MQGLLHSIVLFVALDVIWVKAEEEPSDRIINGDKSDGSQYNWTVWIRRKSTFVCGGTLIERRWVLTAASCVFDGKASDYNVILGDYNRNTRDDEKILTARRIVIHPLFWSKTKEYDMALIKLASAIKLGRSRASAIDQLSSPKVEAQFQKGKTNCVAVGWGEDMSRSGKLRPTAMPQYADTKLLPMGWCTRAPYFTTDVNGCYRAEDSDQGFCQMDAGGPVACLIDEKWTLMQVQGSSVESLRNPKSPACNKGPAVGVKVSSQRKWIDGTLSNTETGMPTNYVASNNRAGFYLLDANKDGVFDRDTGRQFIQGWMAVSNNSAMGDVLLACWESQFIDGSKKLSVSQYTMLSTSYRLVAGMSKEEVRQSMSACNLAAFTIIDDNADGYISRGEFMFVLKRFGHNDVEAGDSLFNWYLGELPKRSGRQAPPDTVPVKFMTKKWTNLLFSEKVKPEYLDLRKRLMTVAKQ